MASTLVRGKYVICKVTGPTAAMVISDGAVFQRNGEIVEVGKYEDLRSRHAATETIGSTNHVVLPGLINSHFHVGLSPFQLGAPDLPLELWALARMGARDVDPYLNHMYGAIQMIKSGITTVQVIYHGRTPVDLKLAEQIIGAYQEAGMRVSYGTAISNQNFMVVGPKGGEEDFASQLPHDLAGRFRSIMAGFYLSTEEHISNFQEICSKYAGNHYERVRVFVAPSNVHRCSDDMLMALKNLAKAHNIGIHVHLQETIYQKLFGLHVWNKTPLQHLKDLELLGPDVTCAHCVWVTDEDIQIMGETGTNVCHLPSSNLRLQSGIAPVDHLAKSGIRIALGSDEAGINDDKDILQEMRLALKLHRLPGIENRPLTGYQVFQMATENGAHVTGFGDHIGALEPGKRADMVLMNLENIQEPYLDPDVSVVDAVVHRGRDMDVDTVMIDGEVVLRDRRLTRIDCEIFFKELKRSLDQPLQQHEVERKALSKNLEPYVRRFLEGKIEERHSPHYCYNARI